MTGFLILLTVAAYFGVLLFVARKAGGKGDNDAFFRGNRQSPWWAVAFGMLGASLSGVSFVSVPGMARLQDMTYMQMCIGFFFGYLIVAFVLLPLYYRLNLTSIYTYLNLRFGGRAYHTGAGFFLLSKMLGAAARLYLVCLIIQEFVFPDIPFWTIACAAVALIWLYTSRSGIKSVVWTDALQTLVLIAALVFISVRLCSLNGFSVSEAARFIAQSPHSQWLEWNDWTSRQHFVKQFLSGIFIVIVMTGLDQDMMQKNLTCRNLKDAQKDMCTYGIMFIPLNLLFLSVGILLLALAAKDGIPLPAKGDDILPLFCAQGILGSAVQILFSIGITAAAFSSADSALTALTTSFCVDIINVEKRKRPERTRKQVHAAMAFLFIFFILLFKTANNSSVLDAVYTVASYTYGPLLGLFSFGLFTKRTPRPAAVPFLCVAAPLLCLALNAYAAHCLNYRFGYELLMLNGTLTFAGLYAASK